MKNKNELNYNDLKMTCDKSLFNFKTTQDLENITKKSFTFFSN